MATGRSLEILIVDDGADEPGAARHIAHAAGLAPSVRVLRQANAGLSAARNAGLDQASGRFVQFLDSDDLLYPGKIDLQIAQLEARPGLIASISRYAVGDPDSGVLRHDHDTLSRYALTPEDFLFEWERGFSVPIHTALFRRDALSGLRFDTDLMAKEDWVFWLALLRPHPAGLCYLPVLGAVYRTHAGAMTRDRVAMGSAFAEASRRIAADWGELYPDFAAASEAWRQQFYGVERGAEPILPQVASDAPLAARLQRANVARRRRLTTRPARAEEPRVMDRLDAPSTAEALDRYRSGRRQVFDDGGRDLNPEEALRLRRLNGLFDRILVGDDAAVILAGSLWSPDVVEPSSARARPAA